MATLPEIEEIERLSTSLRDFARFEIVGHGGRDDARLPIYKVTFGTTDPAAPAIVLVGGVHGLERIGSQVCLSMLTLLSQLVLWDCSTRETLEKIRVVFVPTVNPWGF